MPAFNITEARETARNIQNQLDQARARGRELYGNPSASAAEMDVQSGVIQQLSARLNMINEDIRHAEATQGAAAQTAAATATERGLRDMLRSNEYARAFADALRNGVTRETGRGVEKYNILFNALTVGGGDPVGSDGGFLVPEDIDHMIREQRRALDPLADLFTVEETTTLSGWRVMDAAPETGMAAVDEMAELQSGDQPEFSKVAFNLTKYGLFIPVSGELFNNEVAGLFAYLSRWFAKKAVITENSLLLAALNTLTATAITAGEELKGIKGVLNKVLDPALSQNAVILTNQDGYDVLDNLVDEMGRPVLYTDVATGEVTTIGKRRVKMVSNKVLASAEGAAPIYIGDMTQYASLFRRAPLEIASTNVGGNAWRTAGHEVRAIQYMGVSKFDAAAAAKRTVAV